MNPTHDRFHDGTGPGSPRGPHAAHSVPPLHPLRALLLAGSVPLFLGVLLSDLAYSGSAQVQWKNFASWLNAGALLLSGLALLWAVVALVGRERGVRPALIGTVLLALGWVLGFVNSLEHAKDAHATLPAGLVLSVIVFGLVAAASWFAFAAARADRVLDGRDARVARPVSPVQGRGPNAPIHPVDRAEVRA